MKKMTFFCINLLLLGIAVTGCRRSGGEVWEDTKSCSRYVGRGVGALGGKHGDSRQINDSDDFFASGYDDDEYVDQDGNGYANDFIPLQDDSRSQPIGMADENYRQPRESPGDPGSSVPGIEAFQDPSTNPVLARVFKNVTFEYNSSLIKGQNNLDNLRNIADYMKNNPRTYIFVEGHTDERGAEAYNLALGVHRANAVRNVLIREGANPDRIYTISYGKEKPAIFEHHEEAYAVNRRAEFKVYQR